MMKPRLAVLDDYQRVALRLADWAAVRGHYDVDVFESVLPPESRAEILARYEVVVAMRERTPFPAGLLECLPRLRLLVTTGMWNRAIDMEAAAKRGVQVCGTESSRHAPVELAWALILALARKIERETIALRRGDWQTALGVELHGRTLAVLGLGRLGRQMVTIAKAFGMEVIAWSQNLTREKAEEAGTRFVDRDAFFRAADILTIHVVLSERTRGLVGASELAMMAPSALLVNTSRGAIVDEVELAKALKEGRLGGAALDVYSVEPIQRDHPLMSAPNTLLTPHIGIATEDNYRMYYQQAVEDILAYTDGRALRPVNGVITPLAASPA
jgi:phosphoglycerate dehydrogenase-like enzyme